ncbi:MAG: SMEK domain-containing protein, partial [Prevotellaceae bacterium]|nr:SMEK domain-containing protein [Candidatus Colivivens equi]
MNREIFEDYIDEKLNTLSYRIDRRGKLNVLNYHLHSENFYRDFLNILYGWKLENLNSIQQNAEAIDLLDSYNKIMIQVSATNTKRKIDDTFNKPIFSKYTGYSFKFVSIARPAEDLRKKVYSVPTNISFTPSQDIYDTPSIMNEIHNLDID